VATESKKEGIPLMYVAIGAGVLVFVIGILGFMLMKNQAANQKRRGVDSLHGGDPFGDCDEADLDQTIAGRF
jgi:hypothetical protein